MSADAWLVSPLLLPLPLLPPVLALLLVLLLTGSRDTSLAVTASLLLSPSPLPPSPLCSSSSPSLFARSITDTASPPRSASLDCTVGASWHWSPARTARWPCGMGVGEKGYEEEGVGEGGEEDSKMRRAGQRKEDWKKGKGLMLTCCSSLAKASS